MDGRRIQRSVYGRTERECRAALEDLQRQLDAGADPADPRTTLDEYLVRWLRDVQPTIAPSTFLSYENHVRVHIRPVLGGVPVAKLQPADVRRLIADRLAHRSRGRPLSPATVGLIVTTLRMALESGVRDGTLPRNVAAVVARPRIERDEVQALTEQEARGIVEAVAGHPLEALFLVLLGSGLRLGEAIGLDWRDVHLDEGYVDVRRSKSKVRATQLAPFAVAALRAHRGRAKVIGPAEPVFLGPRTGRRLAGSTASHALPRLLEAAGVRRMHPHDLRHGMATRMLARGVPMRVIADQLGHANPNLTQRIYAHVLPEALRKAVEDVDLPIEGQNEGQKA